MLTSTGLVYGGVLGQKLLLDYLIRFFLIYSA
jgi:hypothetical protein